MNLSLKARSIALLAASTALGAQAQTSVPTRDQVRSEMSAARRDGSIPFGDPGQPLRDLFPARYPKLPTRAEPARAAVRAELEAAIRSGDVLSDGDSGLKLNEIYPSRYPRPVAAAGTTRAQVKAELAQARRTGELVAGGEAGLKLNELKPNAYPTGAAPVYASGPADTASAAMH